MTLNSAKKKKKWEWTTNQEKLEERSWTNEKRTRNRRQNHAKFIDLMQTREEIEVLKARWRRQRLKALQVSNHCVWTSHGCHGQCGYHWLEFHYNFAFVWITCGIVFFLLPKISMIRFILRTNIAYPRMNEWMNEFDVFSLKSFFPRISHFHTTLYSRFILIMKITWREKNLENAPLIRFKVTTNVTVCAQVYCLHTYSD